MPLTADNFHMDRLRRLFDRFRIFLAHSFLFEGSDGSIVFSSVAVFFVSMYTAITHEPRHTA